jgi:hypothetical protein
MSNAKPLERRLQGDRAEVALIGILGKLHREVSNYFQAVASLGWSNFRTWIVPFPELSDDIKSWITIVNRNYVASNAFTLMHYRHEQSGGHSEWKYTVKEHSYNLQTSAEIEEEHATLNVLLRFAYCNTIRELGYRKQLDRHLIDFHHG